MITHRPPTEDDPVVSDLHHDIPEALAAELEPYYYTVHEGSETGETIVVLRDGRRFTLQLWEHS